MCIYVRVCVCVCVWMCASLSSMCFCDMMRLLPQSCASTRMAATQAARRGEKALPSARDGSETLASARRLAILHTTRFRAHGDIQSAVRLTACACTRRTRLPRGRDRRPCQVQCRIGGRSAVCAAGCVHERDCKTHGSGHRGSCDIHPYMSSQIGSHAPDIRIHTISKQQQ